MSKTLGHISRIIRFSAVDGPGNRLVIFLQGCNFNCLNCHNPHTIGQCNYCGICARECPAQALEIYAGDPPWIHYDESRCQNCDRCIQVCPVNSNPRVRVMEVDEVVKEIRRVAGFISGITVSGGEATQQATFVYELFTTLKSDPQLQHLTTFIDSNGSAPIAVWEKMLPVCDGAMIDLKALDQEVHQKLTAAENESVLTSLNYLYQQGKLYEVRLLLIAGINAADEQILEVAQYLASICPTVRIRLIPYRKHGVRPVGEHLQPPTPAKMQKAAEIFRQHGFFDIIVT